MKIEVIRRDNSVEVVEDYFLQLMIDMDEITSFKRSSGWVTIGVDPIRSSKRSFHGRDQRMPSFGAHDLWRVDNRHR
jgi:hypothetical protein